MKIDLSQLVTAADKFVAAKEAKRLQVNTLRDRKETEGFAYADKVFDSDERSVARISNAALAAQSSIGAGVPFDIEWTAKDNSSVPLDAMGMLGMQGALTLRAAQLHGYARYLKSAVEAAETQADLDVLDVESAWPT